MMDHEIKHYRKIAKEIQKILNWTVTGKCNKCNRKIMEDLFEVIAGEHNFPNRNKWWCPECTLSRKDKVDETPPSGLLEYLQNASYPTDMQMDIDVYKKA